MKNASVTAAALLLGLVPAASLLPLPAQAGSVEARSTTLLVGRPEARDGRVETVMPLIEQVGVSARGLSAPYVDDIRVNVSAWGRLDNLRTFPAESLSGDVDLAWVEGRVLGKRLTLRAGRQVVAGGSARLSHFDGLFLDGALWQKLRLAAWGGAPVTPRFNTVRGDALVGTRLSWRQSADTEAGASLAWVLDRGLYDRFDAGLDVRYRVLPALTVLGYGNWSLLEGRLAEVDVGPRYQALDNLELAASYRRTAPDLFLPRSSIFSVFAETWRDEAGATAFYRPLPPLSAVLDARWVRVPEGPGADASLRGTWTQPNSLGRTQLAGQVRLLKVPSNGYLQGRVSVLHALNEALSASVDADLYGFDKAIHGQRRTYATMANLGWRFSPDWHLSWTGMWSVTPYFESRFETMFRLIYNQSFVIRGQTL